MKNLIALLLLLCAFAMGVSACSKEKRFSKHLSSKTGKWDNTVYTIRYLHHGVEQFSETYKDAGYIRFEKNKSYYLFFSVGSQVDVSFGKWSLSGTELMLTTHDGVSSKWTILEGTKKKMVLEVINLQDDEKWVYTFTYEKVR